jgi:hypothetical protein
MGEVRKQINLSSGGKYCNTLVLRASQPSVLCSSLGQWLPAPLAVVLSAGRVFPKTGKRCLWFTEK